MWKWDLAGTLCGLIWGTGLVWRWTLRGVLLGSAFLSSAAAALGRYVRPVGLANQKPRKEIRESASLWSLFGSTVGSLVIATFPGILLPFFSSKAISRAAY